MPDHKSGQVPANNCFRMADGMIVMPVDDHGSKVWLSSDETLSWHSLGGNIKGIHAAVAGLDNGRIIAFGRGGNIDGMMPISISSDRGKTYTYKASEFPPIGGTQKCVLLKLKVECGINTQTTTSNEFWRKHFFQFSSHIHGEMRCFYIKPFIGFR